MYCLSHLRFLHSSRSWPAFRAADMLPLILLVLLLIAPIGPTLSSTYKYKREVAIEVSANSTTDAHSLSNESHALTNDSHDVSEGEEEEEESLCGARPSLCKHAELIILHKEWGAMLEDAWYVRLEKVMIHLIALLYIFVGVSVISDRFLEAIEVITSMERPVRVTLPNGRTVSIPVPLWNKTVADLSLISIGTCASEIMLTLIEVFTKHMSIGEVGPNSMVGSAVYSFFVTMAICMITVGKHPAAFHLSITSYQVLRPS